MAIYGTAYTYLGANGGVHYPVRRLLWYAAGRHWLFYGDGTGLFFKSSVDGQTWSSATQIITASTATISQQLATWFDGAFIHYATNNNAFTELYYRRGTLNSDGTITWSAAEQLAVANFCFQLYGIVTDSDGYPFICYSQGLNQAVGVTKSSTLGIWTTTAGFPFNLDGVAAAGYGAFIVALTGGKVFAGAIQGVVGGASPARGKLWSGADWGGFETITANWLGNTYTQSVVAIGDVLHVSYPSNDNTGSKCAIRSAAGVWSQTTIRDPNNQANPTALTIVLPDVYAIWSDRVTNHVYYAVYSGGAWGAAIDWLNEAVDGITNVGALQSLTSIYSSLVSITVGYSTKTASPYNIQVAGMGVSVPGVPTPSSRAAALKLQGVI